jgi:hypothetical protein
MAGTRIDRPDIEQPEPPSSVPVGLAVRIPLRAECWGSGEGDLEGCASAAAVSDPGGATVEFGQAQDKREANAETRCVGGAGGAAAEAFEYRRAQLAGHARAGVLDGEADAIALATGADPDRVTRTPVVR